MNIMKSKKEFEKTVSEDLEKEKLEFDELTEVQGGVDEETLSDCGLGCFKGEIRDI